MTDIKYCEDCRYFVPGSTANLSQCSYPQKKDAGLALVVRNPPKAELRWAPSERTHTTEDSCGPGAKWFQLKEAEDQ